jgi:hypothetical protein
MKRTQSTYTVKVTALAELVTLSSFSYFMIRPPARLMLPGCDQRRRSTSAPILKNQEAAKVRPEFELFALHGT